MKLLVTGRDGFIASHLIEKIKSSGHEVFSFDKEVLGLETWKDTLMQIMVEHEPEGVFHVGANSNTLEKDVNTMMVQNFDFTYGLALWCSAKDIPLIYSSSASIYGDYVGHLNLYAWSKYGGEAVVNMMGGVSLRYYNVYGAREEHKGAMASMMYQGWLKKKRGEIVTLFPLNPKRDFVYVEDVVSANIYAFENYKQLSGFTYDVGSGEARSFEDVMQLMEIPYSVSTDVSIIPPSYQFYTKADPDRFMRGWEPKFRLEEGIAKYLEYLS